MKLKSFTNKDRYGNMTSFEFYEDSNVPMMEGIPDHPGNPKGTDTVPAWLTPGEFVMNAEATRMFEPQIEQMNNVGRAVQAKQGGTIPEYSAHGGPVYLAEGSSWLDSLLGMFTSSSNEPTRTAKEVFDERIPALQNKANPPTPTRPEPTMSNKMYMDFLKDKEGFRNEAYLDSAGVPTIGYGFTEGVKMGDTMDEKTANERLLKEMAKTDQDYNNLVSADLNPNQQAAVKSLLYNIGGPQFANSKARAALNAGDFESFKKEAAEFRMADGKVIPGLENRRRDELELFFKPYSSSKDDSDDYGDDTALSGPEILKQIVDRETGPVDPNAPDMPVDPGLLAAVEAQKAQVPPMDDVPPKGKPVGEGNKFDIDGDGFLSKEELLAARNQMIPSKDNVKGSASTPLNIMPSGNQIVIQGPDSLIARQEQILQDMIAANAPPSEIYAQQQKIDRINNIAPRQEAFSNVVKAQNKVEPINNQIEDLETQIQRLEAAGLYDRANSLRSEVANLKAEKPKLQAKLDAANAAQDDLYRDATLSDGTVIPDVGKVTADQLEGDGTIPPPPLDLEGGVAQGMDDVPAINEPPKPEEKSSATSVTGMDNEYDEELDSTTQTIIDRIIADENFKDDGTTSGQTEDSAIKTGENADPKDVSKAESFLSDIFGDLFDKDELKRMAIMYVGSRMMGGSHNGSMNFAAKQYVSRVDKKVATKKAEEKALAEEKRLDEKALAKERRQNVFSLIEKGKKTTDSIAAYEKSGDPRDLVDKPVLTKPPTSTGKTFTFYDKGGRGKVTALQMKDDNGNIFYVNSQNKQLNPFAFHQDPSLVPNTQEYIDRELKIGKQMGDALEDLIKRDTITVDKKEVKPVGFASGSQGIEVARWMNRNNIPVNYMGSILESAYAAAAAEQKATGNKVTNITSYLDKAFIDRIPGNEGIFTREDGERVDSGKVMNLIGQGVSILRSKPGQESKSDEQLQNDMIAKMRTEWFALDDKIRGEFNTKGTNEGETGFMAFMRQQIDEDVKQS